MKKTVKLPRQAIRRPMSWPARVAIAVLIPMACGVGIAASGIPRWTYNRSTKFWEIAGLYDSTPVPVRARILRKAPPPLSGALRYVTEGVLYTVFITPAFVLAIFIYDRLTFRYSRDGHLRCLDCGHILQGLTEPRCPECGKSI